MKNITNKGEITKRRIIHAAKHEFYENGYTQATMKNITQRLKYKPSLITYYFKTKDNLVTAIYKDLFTRINKRVEDSIPNIPNRLLFHYVRIRIAYNLFMFDDPTKRFFYEITEKNINYIVNGEQVKQFYLEIIDDFSLIAVEQTLQIMQKYESAGRRDFFMDYINGEYPGMTIDEALNFFERITPIAFNIDADFVDSMLLKSISLSKSIDISDIRFLV